MKNGVKFVVKSSGHFRALFPEERGAAKFHQKFHGIFHGNFHARFQEKISRQHFCTPCRSEYCSTNGRRIAGFPFLRSLEARKVRRYKWGAYCRTNWRCTAVLFRQVVGVGVSETLPTNKINCTRDSPREFLCCETFWLWDGTLRHTIILTKITLKYSVSQNLPIACVVHFIEEVFLSRRC